MVYFLGTKIFSLPYIKIGYTKNTKSLRGRISNIQVGFPEKLECILTIPNGDVGLEAHFHSFCESVRSNGEWFSTSKPNNPVESILNLSKTKQSIRYKKHEMVIVPMVKELWTTPCYKGKLYGEPSKTSHRFELACEVISVLDCGWYKLTHTTTANTIYEHHANIIKISNPH